MTNLHEIYQASDTDDDLLPVVDEHDVPVGRGRRKDVHAQKLRHRAVHVVVRNRAGQVLLQLRSHRKDSHPGWWDISVGGHVDVDEDYDAAAVRELREELGIVAPMTCVARRGAGPESGWEFVRIYECTHDGEVPFHRGEIDAVRWVDAKDLISFGHSNAQGDEWRVTGSGLLSFHEWAHATGAVKS
ncbi:NUDIX domain-containing protein [Candidatus Sumerlaeota bacterium]|nr:NUDIX domain-containing protein [Candidatus Sumerlaeota bacterium]